MLTGLDDVESIDRAYEVGATDFISKPINWGILSHRVRYILRASQAFSDLAKNRAGLESAQRIARLGSWEWDLPRDQVHWSDETYRILGLTPGAAAPASPPSSSACIPKTGRRCRKPCAGSSEPASSTAGWCGCNSPTDQLRHAQLQCISTRDAAGVLTQLSGTIQDVTELKEAEQRIRYLRLLRRHHRAAQPPVLHGAAAAGPRSRPALPSASSACCRWTWTSSSASTTRSGTRPATSC